MTVPDHLLEMKRAYDALAENLLRAAEGRLVVYICNPGNRGDALIRYGTKMFFEDIGLKHIEQNIAGPQGKAHVLPYLSPTFPKKVLFVIGGGGAWSKAYDGAYKLGKLITRMRGELFVLPSTYEFSPDAVRGTMYRRDEAESRVANPKAGFCHDMAFYAAMHRNELGFDRTSVTKPLGIYFRKDLEGKFKPEDLPGENYDISAAGDHLSNVDAFIRELAASHLNLTDRLHVCVGSLIARRPVYLMTGNYFKIRAIYEASMKPFFGEEITLAEESENVPDFMARAENASEARLAS